MSVFVELDGCNVLVSDEDVNAVLSVDWSLDSKGYLKNPYIGWSLHRLIAWRMKMIDKAGVGLVGRHDGMAGVIVDHINRNKFDNTRENLRLATRAENARNQWYHPQVMYIPPRNTLSLEYGFYAKVFIGEGYKRYGPYVTPQLAMEKYEQETAALIECSELELA